MGVSEKRQNFHFGVKYPFQLIKWHNRQLTQTFKKGWKFTSSDRPGK